MAEEPASPPTPVNVRLVYRTGRVVPLELTYEGMNTEGYFVWVSTRSFPRFTSGQVTLTVDVLPPQTVIAIPMR